MMCAGDEAERPERDAGNSYTIIYETRDKWPHRLQYLACFCYLLSTNSVLYIVECHVLCI